MKQLRIRAYMRCGVVSDKYLPIDAILYNQWVRMHKGAKVYTLPGRSKVQEKSIPVLPIKMVGPRSEHWFYSSSFAQWPENLTHTGKSFKTKQGDWLRHPEHYKARGRITTHSGKYKAAHIKLFYITAPYIEWYMVADPVPIIKLLAYCTNIGKNAGDGWGEVVRWEVQEWPEDWSIRGNQNKLMRGVPAKSQNAPVYGLRPSYWLRRHQTHCKLPE